MGEKKVSVRQYIERREQIVIRMNEIADAAEKENKREFTEKETEELAILKREMNVLDVRIASASKTGYVEVTSREAAMDAYLRECLNGKVLRAEVLKREFTGMMTTSTEVDGMVPVTIKDIIQPLEEGLILKKVGLPLMTGLAGDYCWPVIAGNVECEIAGEGVKLTDKTIPFNKIKPEPQRVGITIKITSQTITQTEGVAYNVIVQQISMALQRTLNKSMFGTDTVTHKLVGPFHEIAKGAPTEIKTLTTKAKRKAAKYIAFASDVPTYKELILMKSIVMLKGIEGQNMCYIMDEYTKGVLESTDRGWDGVNQGSTGRMIVENGAIAGIPIFCTNYINDDENTFIGFGCWGYEPMGQFGEQRLIIDPYTEATSDAVRVTLNGDWSMTTLREEAFVLGKCAEPKDEEAGA